MHDTIKQHHDIRFNQGLPFGQVWFMPVLDSTGNKVKTK